MKTITFNNANPISNGIRHGISIDEAAQYRAVSLFSIEIPDSSCRNPLSLSRATIISLQPCVACQEGKITRSTVTQWSLPLITSLKRGHRFFTFPRRETRPSRVSIHWSIVKSKQPSLAWSEKRRAKKARKRAKRKKKKAKSTRELA